MLPLYLLPLSADQRLPNPLPLRAIPRLTKHPASILESKQAGSKLVLDQDDLPKCDLACL